MSEHGKLIVLEGGDGTGKSTQVIDLDTHYRSLGYRTLRTHNDETGRLEPIQEPGGTPAADAIRRRIKDRTIERTPWQDVEWFTEARVILWDELIYPALSEGRHVFTARSYLSTLVYQGYADGVPLEEIEQYTLEKVGARYMSPDFVAILSIQNEVERRRRIQQRDSNSELDTFESKPESFQKAMRDGYVRLATDRDITLIDAARPKDVILNDLVQRIDPIIKAA